MTNATIIREYANIHTLSVEDFKIALDEQRTGWLEAIVHYSKLTEEDAVACIKKQMIREKAEELGLFDDYDDYEEEELYAVMSSTEFETCDYNITLYALSYLLFSISDTLPISGSDGSLSVWCKNVSQYGRYPESYIKLEGFAVKNFKEFKQGMDSIINKINACKGTNKIDFYPNCGHKIAE